MEVVRQLDQNRGRFSLKINVLFDDAEQEAIKRLGLRNCRIQTRDGPFLGKDSITANVRSAFRTQFGRVKNRWSAALVRTTGFVLPDLLLLLGSLIGRLLSGIAKLFFGRRQTLSDVIKGISITSPRIERIKEAEFFILVSLAAVEKAIEYSAGIGQTLSYSGASFQSQIEGLDFAGSGGQLESDFDDIQMLADNMRKVSA